jgi:hypothetical protein
LVNILIFRLCNYDKSPDHVESAGKIILKVSYNSVIRFQKDVNRRKRIVRDVNRRKRNVRDVNRRKRNV